METDSESDLTTLNEEGAIQRYKTYLRSRKKACRKIPRRTMYRLKRDIGKQTAGASSCILPKCDLEGIENDSEVDSHPEQPMLDQSSSSGDEVRINRPYFDDGDVSTICEETVEELQDNRLVNVHSSQNLQIDNSWNVPSTNLQQVDDKSKKALLCMALKLRHNISDTACNDILSLINLCANEQVVPKNKYELKKVVGKHACTEIHHICPNLTCKLYVGIVDKELEDAICNECNVRFIPKINIKEGNFFLHVPLTDQLKLILETHTEEELGWAKNKPVNYHLTDVCDGKMYKNTCTNKDDLSISFSCDGVPVFSSSGFSMWPILCTVNEFSSHQRKRNVMLTSLWFGKHKPEMNVFLKPFVTECQTLAEYGMAYVLNGVHKHSKVFVLIGVCDSVARPLLQCSTQYNGLYGCGLCLHPGEVVTKGRGHTRVYPYIVDIPLRNHVDTAEHMHAAIDEHKTEFGMKQPSILLNIPNFDVVEGLIPDYMHSVLLGICRQFMSLWIDSKNHEEPYYIGTRVPDIDIILLSFQPPLFVSRTPRSITERKFWKAHEWYAWLLYYSIPTLKGILPDRYVNHWGWLVTGMFMLLQNSVSKSEVVNAERILIHFVQHVQILYGKENCSFNVHLCVHLPQSVLNWGPLHAHSAFLYEDYNSELLESIRSSNGVPLQIIDVFQTKLAMMKLKKAFLPYMTCEEKAFLTSVDSTSKNAIEHSLAVCENIRALGVPKHCKVSEASFQALQRLHVEVNRSSHVAYYDRVVINHEMFHSQNYKKVTKRNSYTVMTKNGNIFQIKTFLVHRNNCYAVGKFFIKIKHNYLSRDLKNYTYLDFLVALQDSKDISAVEVADIARKVVFLGSPNPAFFLVCVPPNNLEMLA